MIRRASLLALAVWSTGALADDDRIRTMLYDPDQIVRVVGHVRMQSTIEFGPDERIENVAVGDSSAWQITPNRRANLLFVKPLLAGTRTNMTVVTNHRVYMFDLVGGSKSAAPLYSLKFTYNDIKPAADQPEVKTAEVAPMPPFGPDSLNFSWQMKGPSALLPARAFDDGSTLYLSWPRTTPLPAILTASADRTEGPLNYRVQDDYIVISPVPANLILQQGKKRAVLWTTRVIKPAQPIAAEPRTAAPTAIAATKPQPGPGKPSVRVPAPELSMLYKDTPEGGQNAQH